MITCEILTCKIQTCDYMWNVHICELTVTEWREPVRRQIYIYIYIFPRSQKRFLWPRENIFLYGQTKTANNISFLLIIQLSCVIASRSYVIKNIICTWYSKFLSSSVWQSTSADNLPLSMFSRSKNQSKLLRRKVKM